MQTLINGSQIYKTKINGPYVVSFAKLSFAQSNDIVFSAYTTNQSFYTDFERPPLPDLKLDLSSSFNQGTKINDIEVNLSNVGTAPAFNVFLDIFDNSTYNNNRSLPFMDVGEQITYRFNITNSSNSTLITGIADFENLVDEINETNNIDQNKKQAVQTNITNNTAPAISSIPNVNLNEDSYDSSLDLDSFVNDLENADSLLNWKASGNSNIFVSINQATHIVNFTAQPNFFGSENIKFTVNDTGGLTANDTILVTVNPVNDVPIFAGTIPQSKWKEDAVNSSLNLQQYFSDADSTLKYNFTPAANVQISINNNTGIVTFTPSANFNGIRTTTFTATDTSGLSASSNSVTLNVTPVNDNPSINSFTPTNLNPSVTIGSSLTFNHTSSDADNDPLTYSWKLDGTLKSTSNGWTYIPLSGEAGNHIVILNVSDGISTALNQWNVLVLNQSGQSNQSQSFIDVNNLVLLNDNFNLKIFEFGINNTGNATINNIDWSLNTGLETILSGNPVSLQPNKNAFVFVAYDYPQSGSFVANATAKSFNSQDSQLLLVNVPGLQSGIDAYNLNVLNASGTRRLFEFSINNTLNSSLSNVFWTFDTKNNNIINGTITNVLQPSKPMFVYVDYNFNIPTVSGNLSFNVNATASNNSMKDSVNLTILV